MDDSPALNSLQNPLSNLRRRNSISTPIVVVPANLTRPLYNTSSSSSFPNQNVTTAASPPPPPRPLDFELVSLKSSLASYTSLRDLIPSSPGGLIINSPTTPASAVNSGYEISIRNRLVKQAAWAYLQPMSSSPGSVGTHFFHRICLTLLSNHNPFTASRDFLNRHVIPTLTRAFHALLRIFRVPTAR